MKVERKICDQQQQVEAIRQRHPTRKHRFYRVLETISITSITVIP